MPKINRLAKATREAGGKVVWVQGIYTPETEGTWSVLHGAGSKLLPTAEARQKRVDGLRKGLIGHELWAGMETEPEDLRVPKTRCECSNGLSPRCRLTQTVAATRLRVHAGILRPARAVAEFRDTFTFDLRDGDECLLRQHCARRDDAQLRGDHGGGC